MEVRLYLANARELAGRQGECLPLLTTKRRAQAQAFREEKDRLLHCAAGLLLRGVLHVTRDEDLLCGELGKPELADQRVRFSLSHAGRYAALAVSAHPVGVDIEPIRLPGILPRKMLTGEELEWLESHPGPEDFCLLWTRLESALKAEGCGLAAEKRDFSLLENGKPWYWESLVHDGHWITCAGDRPFTVRRAVLSAEELLNQQK